MSNTDHPELTKEPGAQKDFACQTYVAFEVKLKMSYEAPVALC